MPLRRSERTDDVEKSSGGLGRSLSRLLAATTSRRRSLARASVALALAAWLPSGARRVHADLAPARGGDTTATRATTASLRAVLRASLPLRVKPAAFDGDVLADPTRVREVDADGGWADASPARAVDGDEASAWVGDASKNGWRWTVAFRAPVHLGLIRAHWGYHPSFGVPTSYQWEVLRAPKGARACPDDAVDASEFEPLADARESGRWIAAPTRRSWFVRGDACALRLRVDATVLGPPVLREVELFEPARDVLLDAAVESEGAATGYDARDAADDRYDTAFVGRPGRATWSLTFRLPTAETIDRVSMVLGVDATSRPRDRGVGRDYGVAAGPASWSLETSADGVTFEPLTDTKAFGALPIRRPSIALPSPRTVRALRLVVHGATDMDGRASDDAFPVVREVAAYRAGDRRPTLQAPWFLSVNANPTAQSHYARGGELANDAFFAKFVQQRFSQIIPALARDDRFARALSPGGALREASRTMDSGALLEAIEGDDPALGPSLLAASSPPPIVILSGANDWDYPAPRGANARGFRWDPLRDAASGGMRQLAAAVRSRLAPFLGFCGGAQILALLEAAPARDDADAATIAALLRRNDGRAAGDPAPPATIRSWPGIAGPRPEIEFDPADALFADVAGAGRRRATHALPEWHVDAVRPEAFASDGALSRFRLVAESRFCGAGTTGGASVDPSRCVVIPEAFRSRDAGWPIVGTQFHPEQYDFPDAPGGDPPEAVADPRLFVSAVYELVVDATLRRASPASRASIATSPAPRRASAG